jgi:hypothetical protein
MLGLGSLYLCIVALFSVCAQESGQSRGEKIAHVAIRMKLPPSDRKLAPDLLAAVLTDSTYLGYSSDDAVIVAIPEHRVAGLKHVKGMVQVSKAPSDYTKIQTLIISHSPDKMPKLAQLDAQIRPVRTNKLGYYIVVESTEKHGGFSGRALSRLARDSAITYIEPNFQVSLPPPIRNERREGGFGENKLPEKKKADEKRK